MDNHTTPALPYPGNYDKCLIASSLKKLFPSITKSKAEHNFVVSRSIDEVKSDLERLNNNNKNPVELSYSYLLAMEQTIQGADFRYAVVYKNKTPVVFVYFQLFTLTSLNFSLKKNREFIKRIIHFFIDLKKIKVLIAGNVLRNDTICFCYDKNFLNTDEATEVIATVAGKIADTDGATAVILKDIAASSRGVKWLAKIGYQSPLDDQVMTMDINIRWESIGDYINDLSRKYKTRAKKIVASGSTLIVKQLTEDEIVFYYKEIIKLYNNVIDSQSFLLTRTGNNYIARLKEIYKDGMEVFGYFLDQKLTAFYTGFVTKEAYELYYVGFDYERNNEHNLYFNILFSGLERAILLKKKELKLGRTSFDAKASLGAKPVAMNYYIKTDHIHNVVMGWFVNYFSSLEDGKWKLRNPIK